MLRIPKWLLIGGCSLLAALILFLAVPGGIKMVAAKPESVRLPAVMYHHVLNQSDMLGDYVISPKQLDEDLRYIQERGYTPVSAAELQAYVAGEGELPERPILITFDDGYKSSFVYAYPALKKYGMKGILAVIGIHSEYYSEIDDDNVNYAHATWDELRQMSESGVFEIANHTYDMHEESSPRAGVRRKAGESKADYQKALREDIGTNQQLLEMATGKTPTVFVYPFGFLDEDARAVLDELGFTMTMGVAERVNTVTRGEPESLRELGRYNRPYGVTTQSFFDPIFAEAEREAAAK